MAKPEWVLIEPGHPRAAFLRRLADHTIERIKWRYGITIDDRGYFDLCQAAGGPSAYVCADRPRIPTADLRCFRFAGQDVLCFYYPTLAAVASALPMNDLRWRGVPPAYRPLSALLQTMTTEEHHHYRNSKRVR